MNSTKPCQTLTKLPRFTSGPRKTFRPEAANALGSLLDELNRALAEEDEDGAA